ncbi:TetR/AcrR family transcriptional regulator [Gallaecimonas mangrovi]|uniref:TetR/AcrR family transcriptional regulator n=1 Tax=Gallaecimonas mangrovi TaxID=2291597 RepID=UPI0018660860|nr:TetR family transcriptional regulator [Gallaecimonas mangrovi]
MKSTSSDAGDTRARILDIAESLLKRYGLEKLNVVDVARALNMSHGNVYRHFSSKAALREAVIHRWLDRVVQKTDIIAKRDAPADQRLTDWLKALAVIKQRKVVEDAEMLAAAVKVVRNAPSIQNEHARLLTAQVVGILEAGLLDGTLPGAHPPQSTAIAILDATTKFHHPEMVAKGGSAQAQMVGLERVLTLIMVALTAIPEFQQ